VEISSIMPPPNTTPTSMALVTTTTTTPGRIVDPIRRQIENAGTPHVVTPPRPAGTSQSALVTDSGSAHVHEKKPKAAKLARGESRTPAFIIVSSTTCVSRVWRVKADVVRPSTGPGPDSALSRPPRPANDAGKSCLVEYVSSCLVPSIRWLDRLTFV
jgi:hypothetical protein